MHKRWAILVLVLLGICTITTIAEAGTEVTWYFKDTNVSGFSYPSGHIFDKFMNRTETPTGTADYTVTLGPGESAWWYANEAAECDLTFLNGVWRAEYWVNATNSTDKDKWVYTRLHIIASNGSDIFEKYGTERINNPGEIEKIEEQPCKESITIPKGGRVALEIYWVSTANGSLIVYYNSASHDSKLVSPPDNYPIPEFPTLALPLAIVLGIMSLLFKARKRNNRGANLFFSNNCQKSLAIQKFFQKLIFTCYHENGKRESNSTINGIPHVIAVCSITFKCRTYRRS